jgi:hypothetical protein
MDQMFSKPQYAREVEARARARHLGVEVRVVVEAHAYTSRSQSRPGVRYAQRRTPAGWACTCAGYAHTGCCKHLGQVERRAEREGWDFGTIAPLHRAAKYFPLTAAAPDAAAPNVVPFPAERASEGVTSATPARSAA